RWTDAHRRDRDMVTVPPKMQRGQAREVRRGFVLEQSGGGRRNLRDQAVAQARAVDRRTSADVAREEESGIPRVPARGRIHRARPADGPENTSRGIENRDFALAAMDPACRRDAIAR